ncbi:MAG: putative transcriptional regulator [Bacteroidetes bacterium OLB11]|nr:MAG: putative transcriptional regulator [Bacteroidetes bacterium OLB11]
MDQLSLFKQLEDSQTPHLSGLAKVYYSITEVAAMFQVNASMLRFWEKEFPTFLGNIKKNKKGDRYYNIENINNLKIIFHLVKEKKNDIGRSKRIFER